MYRIAHEVCEANNVPFEILKPLITETANKINTSTPYVAQTGPAKRGDQKTIESHLKKLNKDIHKETSTSNKKLDIAHLHTPNCMKLAIEYVKYRCKTNEC